ncbi:hypothetical protein B9Z55_004175 [Caenorhabditis nigoni]|uniref:MULE transposase domain-containing protein n=1 Tax=Caenorhabditis nigoni TaxID=1611254 RepID=A0A2G5UV53_9PELO|nr:hypothetical protein B9Z55_004175 [Caenorhabditis nigoni]
MANITEDLKFVMLLDKITEFSSVLICVPGAVFNAMLIYLILKRTPLLMKSYSVYLMNFAFFDFATCIISFFSCQKVIFSGWSLIYIFHGPCKHVSSWFCYFCHCFECHTLAHSQWILLGSFMYRYDVLKGSTPTVQKMWRNSGAFYSMSLCFLVVYLFDINLVLSGNISMFAPITFISIMYMTTPCVPIYCAIFYFRHHTLKILSNPSINLSPVAKISHQKLVKALTLQAGIPIFWLVASGIYSLAQFGFISGPIPENITFRLMDCIPMVSPIVTIAFIQPYRDRKAKCPASYAVHDITGNIRIVNDHMNHEVDNLRNQGKLARQELQRKADSGTCKEVIDSVRNEFGPEVSLLLGGYNTKRSTIYRARRSDPDEKVVNNGGTVRGKWARSIGWVLILNFSNSFLSDDKRFLYHQSTTNGLKYVIFATDKGLELLSKSDVVLVDGTFQCVPQPYVQLFTFHIYLNEEVTRPVVYALLPNKTTFSYKFMLDELKKSNILVNWNPKMLICDFEIAIRNAFESVFPTIEISGCLFHLIQNWRRSAESSKVYVDFIDGSHQEFWQLLKVLPYIEAAEIPHYFKVIMDTLPANAISVELKETAFSTFFTKAPAFSFLIPLAQVSLM